MPRGQYDRTKTKEQRAAEKAAALTQNAAPASAKPAKVAKAPKVIEKTAAKRPYNRKNPKVAGPGFPEAAPQLGMLRREDAGIGSLYEIERHTNIVQVLSTANVGSVATNGSLIQKAGKLLALHLDAATIRAEAALKELLPKLEPIVEAKAPVVETPAAPPAPVVRSFNPPTAPPAPASA